MEVKMRNSGAELIGGLFGIAILGLGTWGSYAIGSALGFYGSFAFITGAGVIAGGILGLCVVGVGLYCAGVACKAAFTTTRDYFRSLSAERAARREREQALVASNMSTRTIMQNVNNNTSVSKSAMPASAPPAYTSNMYPPLYQSQRTIREERDNPYYAPPTAYRNAY